MKIRDLILAVLIIGMILSTGTLVVFASTGISDIKDTTTQASSGELVEIARDKLYSSASSVRNSLDRQMQSTYDMVKAWSKDPAILGVAREAQQYTLEELFDLWSDPASRPAQAGEVPADGNLDNDLDPSVSHYLENLVRTTDFVEIFITDNRGYVISASGATSDFDQGPDDWRLFNENDQYEFKQHKPLPGGEDWYKACNESAYGFYVSDVTWDDSANEWVIEIVSQLRDPDTDEYLGVIKFGFDYGTFIQDLVYIEALDFYEIKVTDSEGLILSTSLEDTAKVNNVDYMLDKYPYFSNALDRTSSTSDSGPFIDENGESVYAAAAVSIDVNEHIIIVTLKESSVEAPIDAFVGNLQSNISDKSSSVNTLMIVVGVCVTLVIIVIAFLLMRAKISRPLAQLTTVSDKLSRGEIDGLTIDVHGKDEISSFGESFKGVLAAFNFLKDEIEKKQ